MPEVQSLIDRALAEDQAFNDPTTSGIIPADLTGRGIIRSKAEGVLAGVEVCLAVFRRADPSIQTVPSRSDGSPIAAGDAIASVEGSAGA